MTSPHSEVPPRQTIIRCSAAAPLASPQALRRRMLAWASVAAAFGVRDTRAQAEAPPQPQTRSEPPPPPLDLDPPFVRTPNGVVDAMLDLAGIGPGDRLIDLGSGDGRIVLAAARRFGVPGLGVDIDPTLVERARAAARAQGLAHLARFEVQDLYETDLSQASVITLYLLPDVNLKLRPRLQALRPGVRIVSHDWDMGDWPPQRTIVVPAPDKPVGRERTSRLMLWVTG